MSGPDFTLFISLSDKYKEKLKLNSQDFEYHQLFKLIKRKTDLSLVAFNKEQTKGRLYKVPD